MFQNKLDYLYKLGTGQQQYFLQEREFGSQNKIDIFDLPQ